MSIKLRGGDIVLVRGSGLLSNLIRKCQRGKFEGATKVSHVGGVSVGGLLLASWLVEALKKGVVERLLLKGYGGKRDGVCVYRPKFLTYEQRRAIVRRMRGYVGRKYGFVKIAAHFCDSLLGGAYFFRRMCRMEKYPICSWVVGYAYYKETGYKFCGMEPNACQPDDIWDECFHRSPEKWELILPLQRLEKE